MPNLKTWPMIALGVFMLCQPLSAQVGGAVQVRVLDGGGVPVGGVKVCAGTAQDRGAQGGGITNASGVATIMLVQPAASTEDRFIPVLVNQPIVVTANVGGKGAQATVAGPMTAIITLPSTVTGPTCPGTVASSAGAAGIQVQRSVVLADLARSGANTPLNIERPTILTGRAEKCFGAIGSGCGEGNVITAITGGPFAPSTCSDEGDCTINAGSWQHDECCAMNATGGLCDGKFEQILTGQALPGKSADVCQGALNLGAQRIPTLYNWKRRVDRSRTNTTRRVEHALYCAQPGSFMPEGEQRYCCSQQVRIPNPIEAVRLLAHPLHLPFIQQARVCT